MTQGRAQQTGPDLLTAILESGPARAVVKGGMAAFALKLIEPHLDTAPLTKPPQPTDEFVAGHMVANMMVSA